MKQQKNKLDEIDKLLYDYYEKNQNIPQKTVEVIKNTPHKKKNKLNFSRVAILILTISIFTTGVVFANEIVGFFKGLFGLNEIGINNDSIVNAIENEKYIQNTGMQYTKINDDYSIKIDYIMIDDINLYTVFNLHSKNEMESNYRISIPDLKIIADDKIIYDASAGMNYSIYVAAGWHKIIQENNKYKRELLFLNSNGFPTVKKLEYKFSTVILYNSNSPDNKQYSIDCKDTISLKVNIIEKFINRDILNFEVENKSNIYKINKFISNYTGTYIIYETKRPEICFNLNYDGKNYEYNKTILAIDDDKYIFISQYNITKKEIIKKENLNIIDSQNNKINIL